MNIAATPRRMTFEEFIELPDSRGYELQNGLLVEKQVGNLSSAVGSRIETRLRLHCESHALGEVFNSESLYRCFPERPNSGRKPDASFIAKDHLPADWQTENYFRIAPDLAVEVISPNDSAHEVREKREEYLQAGVRLVWIIYPEGRLIEIYRADGSAAVLRGLEQLSGEDVVAGFTCPIADLFPPTAQVTS